MAKFLVTWELGGGLGHLGGLKPVVGELVRRGHRVDLALRDLTHAGRVFGDVDVSYWQAPFSLPRQAPGMDKPETFGQMLANVGFGDYERLSIGAAAWRSIFQATKPDVVLFEHSPMALLAAREHEFRRVVIGVGFSCPTTEPDLPRLRAQASANPPDPAADGRALGNARQLLLARGQPPLESLADLYRQVDATLLCTYPELDHFGPRSEIRYYGCQPDAFGKPFRWPPGDGKRIFVYLKPFPALGALLQCLATWRFPTVAYLDRFDPALERRHATVNLHFHREPLDICQAAAECDLAILNGGHGTLAAMLLAGKPSFLLPLYWEQLMQARRARQEGFADLADPGNPTAVETKLRQVLASPTYGEAARGFAEKYATHDSAATLRELADDLERLAGASRQ